MDLLAQVATVAGALGIVGLFYEGLRRLRDLYGRTLGSRRAWQKKLDGLACGVTLGYAKQVLGEPAFRQTLSLHSRIDELVFRTPHAWVQLLVHPEIDVIRLAVTVTDHRFHFSTSSLSFGQLDLHLGQDRYASAPLPGSAWAWSGARRWGYIESHEFGNPGAYQPYLLCSNDATSCGAIDIAALDATAHPKITAPLDCSTGNLEVNSPTWVQVRGDAIPDTFVVAFQNLEASMALLEPVGVDLDHVRVLPTADRRRWRK